jgi:hypothetical protein
VVSWGWNGDPLFAPAGLPDPADERRDLAIPPEQGGKSRFIDEQERQGTRDPAACLSVPASMGFQAEHDWTHVRLECHELLREARRRIEELTETRNPVSSRIRVSMLCPDSRTVCADGGVPPAGVRRSCAPAPPV